MKEKVNWRTSAELEQQMFESAQIDLRTRFVRPKIDLEKGELKDICGTGIRRKKCDDLLTLFSGWYSAVR